MINGEKPYEENWKGKKVDNNSNLSNVEVNTEKNQNKFHQTNTDLSRKAPIAACSEEDKASAVMRRNSFDNNEEKNGYKREENRNSINERQTHRENEKPGLIEQFGQKINKFMSSAGSDYESPSLEEYYELKRNNASLYRRIVSLEELKTSQKQTIDLLRRDKDFLNLDIKKLNYTIDSLKVENGELNKRLGTVIGKNVINNLAEGSIKLQDFELINMFIGLSENDVVAESKNILKILKQTYAVILQATKMYGILTREVIFEGEKFVEEQRKIITTTIVNSFDFKYSKEPKFTDFENYRDFITAYVLRYVFKGEEKGLENILSRTNSSIQDLKLEEKKLIVIREKAKSDYIEAEKSRILLMTEKVAQCIYDEMNNSELLNASITQEMELFIKKGLDILKKLKIATPPGQVIYAAKSEKFDQNRHELYTQPENDNAPERAVISYTVTAGLSTNNIVQKKAKVFVIS